MSRVADLKWFERNRKNLAQNYPGKWVAVHEQQVVGAFATEEEAILASVEKYGVDVASVFYAATDDPFSIAG